MVSAWEQASAYDRLWFEKHPGETDRCRHFIPGEFGDGRIQDDSPLSLEVEEGWVEVIQVAPGERVRRLLTLKAIATATDNDAEDAELL